MYAPEEVRLKPNRVCAVPLGITVVGPEDWWFQIAPRSGLAARGLMVLGGVVDPGFRGELVALLGWMAPADAEVWVLPAGSRIAQLLPHQRPSGIEDEGSRERGERGLGSSGV